MSGALTDVRGIGAATAKALAAAGIADAAALAAIDPEAAPELKDFAGTPAWRDWVEAAKAVVDPATNEPSTSEDTASPARRRFPVRWAVRIGGKTFKPGGKKGPALTSAEHEELTRTGAIATPWNEGESA